MSEENGPNGSDAEGESAKSSGFGNAFSSGKDRASDAEKSAEKIVQGTPGAGDGDWDEAEESVSGDVSAYVHRLESGRDPWHPRQTAHGALDVMKGFLGAHFKNFQAVADGQRKVSEDPRSASSMAAATAKSSAGEEAFRSSTEIGDEDQPNISEEVQRGWKGDSYQAVGAVLVAGGMESAPDVAVDPSLDKAYVITAGGKLYGVDLTAHTKRRVVTSGDAEGSLGTTGGVALDGNGHAYVTDTGGSRLLRVHLATGHTEKIATVQQAYGVRLDRTGKKAYVTGWDGKLFEVDLQKKEEEPKKLAEDLGTTTSAVALDGKGKAYTGNQDETGSLREIDLTATPSVKPRLVAKSSTRRSGGIALDGAGAAYVGDHWTDVLYRVDLASGKEREAVKASGHFSPRGVALDGVNGVVYVSTWEGQLWRFSLRVLQSPELIEITTGV
ncbi:hypothetical protein ACLGIH_03835 [Streptomyces sp. HMX87]|uniref:hypothetical protein n=1 Tax=Streptomyces sp. HMX87 TaxID=3390849 RepID=UPI003A8895DE